MELDAEQIIKAFEVCRDNDLCNVCPYEENIDCLRLREKHAIALMKSQEQRIKELTEEVEWSAKRILKADKKVAKLTKQKDNWIAISKDFQKTIDELIEDNEAQSKTITNLLKTIEGVQGVKSEYETFIGGMKSQIDKIKADVKADTVRKMQERAREMFLSNNTYYASQVFAYIDQIAKELLEGGNG